MEQSQTHTRVPPPISSTARSDAADTPWLSALNSTSVHMLRRASRSLTHASSSVATDASHLMSRSTPSGHGTFSTSTTVLGTVPRTCTTAQTNTSHEKTRACVRTNCEAGYCVSKAAHELLEFKSSRHPKRKHWVWAWAPAPQQRRSGWAMQRLRPR